MRSVFFPEFVKRLRGEHAKPPIHREGLYPENNLFVQVAKLKNMLRAIGGEELITHVDQTGEARVGRLPKTPIGRPKVTADGRQGR